MATNTRALQPIDAYLASLNDPAAKKTLGALRLQLRKLLPGAVETISYRIPTFKVDGNAVAGFAFFKTHCGYYPFSGSVVPVLKPELEGYSTSKSGVTFPPDKPLPAKLVKKLVQARLAELATKGKKPAAVRKNARITDRVTDSAVKEATGRDWKAWMRALDTAGAAELNHKQLVAHLVREVESGWWQQSIAVAYEQARGKRVVGETALTGFQVGVVRTLPMTATTLWELVTKQAERWLGAGAKLTLEPGKRYEVPKRRGAPGVRGEIRVVKPGQRVRMTWQPDGWEKPATLQLSLVPKARGVAFHVHMEKLPDAKAREAMREHWSKVLGSLAKD
ncbi:SRPBCC domain-containing protein [Myxococcus sp. RHSTA-1-4]|uniref:SRPBCC domain-containing protein n=1 Tax=Myxococcus sp. RHSTA-1-4 TaxID=2874601 RepID=UPI001CBD9F17|nr:SRPBCC domain-containing protein [Myxococcus sp. RHSTA-1-4]MBZ4420988.1 SRPBCC domain-containing protein [Myxococcus sp. RHSTA-1-4]